MFDKASKKLGLDQAVLHGMNTPQGPSPAPDGKEDGEGKKTAIGLSKEEISRMLQHGAYALFRDDTENEKASATFCEEDIGQIMERRSKRMVWMNDMQGSMFSKATFKISEDGADVDVNAPDFWEKVIPSAMTPKMLFDQFSKIVNSEASVKEDWVKNKKLLFMSNLSDLIAEVIRSFSDAKGAALMDRDILKSVLFLCTNNPTLFSDSELDSMNKWLDDIDYGRRRRQSRPAEVFEMPVPRPVMHGHRGRPRKSTPLADDYGSGMEDDISDDMSDGAFRPGGRRTIKKRPRPGEDGDSDFDGEGGAFGDSGDDDDDDGEGYGKAGRSSSKRGSLVKHKVPKGPWTKAERHLVQNGLFSICRPNWALILERSKLGPRPLVEVQEMAILLVKLVENRATTKVSMEVFSQMYQEFEAARMTTIPPYNNGKKDRRTLAEIQSLVEVPQAEEKALFSVIDSRIAGWTKRIILMNGIRREMEKAKEAGKVLLDNFKPKNLRTLNSWWIHEPLDRDILIGVDKYGWGSWDTIIYDKDFGFYEILKMRFPECFGVGQSDAPAEGKLEDKNDDDEFSEDEGIEKRKAKRARTAGTIPTHGIEFHKYISWPAARTLEHYMEVLVQICEKGETADADGDEEKEKDKKKKKKSKKKKHHKHHRSHRHKHKHHSSEEEEEEEEDVEGVEDDDDDAEDMDDGEEEEEEEEEGDDDDDDDDDEMKDEDEPKKEVDDQESDATEDASS